jgi:hypothetical protein
MTKHNSVISSVLCHTPDNQLLFLCPGCEKYHTVKLSNSENNSPVTWNRDITNPTFRPSLSFTTDVAFCHVLITDGNIFFVKDSTHKFAGKILRLPPHGFKP